MRRRPIMQAWIFSIAVLVAAACSPAQAVDAVLDPQFGGGILGPGRVMVVFDLVGGILAVSAVGAVEVVVGCLIVLGSVASGTGVNAVRMGLVKLTPHG